MTITALKKELYKTIDAIEDNAILEAVYTILKPKSVTKKVMVPMSKTEFLNRNDVIRIPGCPANPIWSHVSSTILFAFVSEANWKS